VVSGEIVAQMTNALALKHNKQVVQLSQTDRTAGWISLAKSGRLELGDNIYGL